MKFQITTQKLLIAGTLLLNVVAFENCTPGFSAAAAARSAGGSRFSSINATTPDANSTPTPTPTPVSCAAPRHYQYTLTAQSLSCNSYAVVGTFPVSDTGYALAQTTLQISNSGDSSGLQHFRAQTVVGDSLIAPAAGGDVVRGSTASGQSVLGYGFLSSGSTNVVVNAVAQGDNCRDGLLQITGGTVDVWVEDAQATCQGQDIVVASTLTDLASKVFNWTDTARSILSVNATAPANRSSVTVMTQTEGGVKFTPNWACSDAILTTQAFLNNQPLNSAEGEVHTMTPYADFNFDPGAAFGHGLLSTSQSVTITNPLLTVNLDVTSSVEHSYNGSCSPFPTTSGNDPGNQYYGDAMIAYVFAK